MGEGSWGGRIEFLEWRDLRLALLLVLCGRIVEILGEKYMIELVYGRIARGLVM